MPRARTGDKSSRATCPNAPAAGVASPVHAAHAYVFNDEKILDAVFRAFAADPGLLDAAEGRHFVGKDCDIDRHDALLQRFRDAPYAADVAAVEIARQPEFSIV